MHEHLLGGVEELPGLYVQLLKEEVERYAIPELAKGVKYTVAKLGGQAVVLDTPCPVPQLPGFADGEVSVQDAAAQMAAPRAWPSSRVDCGLTLTKTISTAI